uniref:Olfactory receptor n=1 Tax=Pseudonaja textilis TaxID=8673 RepID=A0A670ZE61_PSETE
ANPEKNQTRVTLFILLGFQNLEHLWFLPFLAFLFTYIFTMTGNLLIFVLVVIDQHLHTPMYFFLCNLACLEICYSSTLMLASLLTGDKSISLQGCMTQLYFFGFLASTECCLLSVMSYDRFLAICRPLHYATSMKSRLCIQLAAGSWISSMALTSIYSVVMSTLWFCGPNEIDHFFCESLPLIGLSCSDATLVKYVSVFMAFILTFLPFTLTVISYACIINTISRIPSSTGRQKAFSTCSSHLIVVSLFYGTLIITYLMPESKGMKNPSKIFSVLYTVIPPFCNPLIYSLRNRDVKEALNKLLLTSIILFFCQK